MIQPINELLRGRVLRFFNNTNKAERIVGRIYDDPNFGRHSKKAVGVSLAAAKRILKAKAGLDGGVFSSLWQIEGVDGVGSDAMHDILYSFMIRGKRLKAKIDQRICDRVLSYFNSVNSAIHIVKTIQDDPNFGTGTGRGCSYELASKIVSVRNSLPGAVFTSLSQIQNIKGLGSDTFHDILSTFWKNIYDDSSNTSSESYEMWEEKLYEFEGKLLEPSYQIDVLTDYSNATAGFGVPDSSALKRVMPPALNRGTAAQFVDLAAGRKKQVIEGIQAKVVKGLQNRDNERIKRVVERLKTGGLRNSDGSFTEAAKTSISEALQDPIGLIESLGVSLSDEERNTLWRGVSQKEADALAEWKSRTESDELGTTDSKVSEVMQEIAAAASDDPELRMRWLTDPEGVFVERYPDASRWQLSMLPDAITVDEAKEMLEPGALEPLPAINTDVHNSSDLKIGFSIQTVHEIFKHMIDFPLAKQYPDNTQSPFAFLEILELPYPVILNPGKNLLQSTGKARFTSYILENKYEFTLEIKLAYSILATGTWLFFVYDAENTEIIVNEDSASQLSTKPKEVLDGIFRIMGNSFAYEIKLPDFSLPIGDQVEIVFDSITVHDDKDALGSGELYFELGINGNKYLFGQYDANSGDLIPLNKRFLISADDAQQLVISVRGKDRDTTENSSDYMGDDVRTHLITQNLYGAFELNGYTSELQMQMVWTLIEVSFSVVCWIVDAVVYIYDACARLVGAQTQQRQQCSEVANEVFGFVESFWMANVRNYTLAYHINPVPAPVISNPVDILEFSKLEMTETAVYVGFDMKDIAGLVDNAAKTAFKENLDNEVALIVSENLLSKGFQAINVYGPVSNCFTTGFDDITTYYSLEVRNHLQVQLDNGAVYVTVPVGGKAGANLWAFAPTIDAPDAIIAKLRFYTDGLIPFNGGKKIYIPGSGIDEFSPENGTFLLSVDSVWLRGGGLFANLVNLLAVLAQAYFYWPKRLFGIGDIALCNLSTLTPEINEYYRLEFTPKPTVTTGDEIVFRSKVGVGLIDPANIPQEKIFNEHLLVAPLDETYGVGGAVVDELKAASSMTIDDDGNVYVIDISSSTVLKFDPQGNKVHSWGGWGVGDGQLAFPFDIKYDKFAGRLLVSDTVNRRIQIFDTDGNYLAQFGGWTDGNYNFNVPQLIAASPANGDLFVIDAAKNFRVQHFDTNLNFIGEWGGNGNDSGMFVGVTSIVANNSGEVFITDFSDRKIKKYMSQGEYVPDWAISGETDTEFLVTLSHLVVGQHGEILAYSPGLLPQIKIYDRDGAFLYNVEPLKDPYPGTNWNVVRDFVIDYLSGAVYILEDKLFKFLLPEQFYVTKIADWVLGWGAQGGGDGQFQQPHDAATDSLGNVYVADRVNHRIQKFTMDGNYILQWGGLGTGPGALNLPTGVAVDSHDNVYVVDSYNHRIQKFDVNGNLLFVFTGDTGLPLYYPQSIAIDDGDDLYILDRGNTLVRVVDMNWVQKFQWGTQGSGDGQLNNPMEIAVDSQHSVYIADTANQRIQKFTPSGDFVWKAGLPDFPNSQYFFPYGIDVDASDRVFVVERQYAQIHVFSPAGELLDSFGGRGSAEDQFLGLYGLHVSKQGNLYALDSDAHRITLFKVY